VEGLGDCLSCVAKQAKKKGYAAKANHEITQIWFHIFIPFWWIMLLT
jgi:hypothetical protein